MFGGGRRPGRAASRPAEARPGVARNAWRWGRRQTAAAAAVMALVAGVCVAVQVAALAPASAAATMPTPAGWWPFSEGSGTTTADSSGNGHTGTLGSGVNLGGAGGGRALDRDQRRIHGQRHRLGSGDQHLGELHGLRVGEPEQHRRRLGLPDLRQHQRYCLPTSTTVSGMYLTYQQSVDHFALAMRASDSTLGHDHPGHVDHSAQAGVWYHLVGVYNLADQTISLYVNGALQATTAFTTPWQATGNTIIGDDIYGGRPLTRSSARSTTSRCIPPR